jgi:hypothetical protein
LHCKQESCYEQPRFDPEKNAALINIAIEAAHTMVGMLAAIEKKLRHEHPAVQLYGSVL